MSEAKFKLSPRLENVVKGIFLILFAIVLSINAGKVARTLVFVPLYLFGAAYYYLTFLMVVNGLYRIIFGRKLKIKSYVVVIGMFLLLFALIFLMGAIMMKVGGFDYSIELGDLLSNYNAQLSGYYSSTIINVVEPGSYWGGGLVFILLGKLIGSQGIVIALCVMLFLLSFLMIFIKPIILLVQRIKRQSETFKATKRVKHIEEEKTAKPVPEIVPLEPEPEEINEKFQTQYGFEPEEEINNYDGGFEQNSNLSLDEQYNKQIMPIENSEFTPLVFGRQEPQFDSKPYQTNAFIQEQERVIAENQNLDDYFIEHDNNVEEKPSFEEEQTIESSFASDSVAEPVLDEEMIKQQPVFEEPIIKEPNRPVTNPTPVHPPAPKKKERVVWIPPSSELLDTYETTEAIETNSRVAEERVVAINQVLNNFGIGARCTSYTIGSSVTRYNIEYDANVSVKAVEKLVSDIQLRLGGVNARFTPIVQGQSYSGLEIPNAMITTVGFKEVFEALPDVKKHMLSVGFGKDISGNVIAADFDEFPHLLVAGTTGSGKSIYIHSIIATLIMRVSPDDLKIVLVDPKKVEMTKYRDMPHLLCPIITEAEKAKVMMSKLADEMNDRYERFAIADSCSNIKQYNEWAKEHDQELMPYIIAVLDEYADLVDTCKEISQPVVSIAQKARAAGIHMLISTQRPSTNVITGVIKGNLPTHVALMTSSYTDSMTILGEGGAEKLLGKGDMLVQSPLVSRVGLTRLQGCYIQNREIGRIVGYLKEHYETVYDPNYLDLVDHSQDEAESLIASGEVEKEVNSADEEKYQSIKEWVMTQEFVSMSKIQRECGVGFNRAGKFFSRLQKEGIVSTQQDGATKGCKVLVHDDYDSGDSVVTSDELIS